MLHVTCIAEIASSHDGELGKLRRLVEAARQAKADAVKLQWWSNADRLADRRRVGNYYRGVYRRYAIPLDWLDRAREWADPLALGCTVYLPEDAQVVAPLVDWVKISSFEVTDDALVQAVEDTDKPLLASVGMCSHQETADRVLWREWLREQGRTVDLLHCVSAYAAPLGSLNLAVLRAYDLDGFSDHTATVSVGALATAAGARILETHLRLVDTDARNPDFACALSPSQYAKYVAGVRVAEAVLGSDTKAQQEAEAAMAAYRVGGGHGA